MPEAAPTYHREQLLHLLAEAAEIEHNLLCTYLFAAFSLKRSPVDALQEDESRLVESWRKSIMAIALEEMTHLVIVANLSVAVGARPHFDRPNLPVAAGYHPADLVARLAPFSMDTLDHFIFLERPAGMSLPDGAGFQPEVPYVRSQHPGARLMPYADDYETVSGFYQRLRDAFVHLSGKLGDAALFCGDPRLQVDAEVLSMPGIAAVTGLESALTAIDTIIEQGEGSPADIEDSHFARFCAMKADYARMLAERPGFQPARPVATNPVMRRPVVADRVHVDAPAAAEVLDLANALYNLLLRMLSQAFGRADADAGARRVLLDVAIDVMHAFDTIGAYLATLPASEELPGVHAGVTFTVLRATEPFLEGRGEWILLGERVEEVVHAMRLLGVATLQPALRRLDQVAGKLAGRRAAFAT